ncbi:hypothetical protein Tco_1306813, partial [Tanacetum coccineum]
KPPRNEEKCLSSFALLNCKPKELSGSSTMFLGISDQWTKEVRAKAHSSMRMTVDSPRGRKCSGVGDHYLLFS